MSAGIQVSDAVERVRSFARPVLSLYLNTNPGDGMTTEEVRARSKAALDQLELPNDIRDTASSATQDAVPWAPSLALFVGSGKDEVEWIQLPVDLPVHDPKTGQATARLGEPFMTPLRVARDADEKFLLLQVDKDECRLMEVTPHDIELVEQFRRSTSVRAVDEEQSKSPDEPRKVADKAEARSDDRMDDLVTHRRRFFSEVWKTVKAAQSQRSGKLRIVLMGPVQDRAAALDLADEATRDEVVMELGGLPRGDESLPRLLEEISPELRAFCDREKAELIDLVQGTGVTGLEAGLRAWQRGQLQTVIIPFPNNREVYVDTQSGYTSATPDGARALGTQATVELHRLDESIERLAKDFDVELSFVGGQLGRRVEQELGGMAAIPRW